MDVAGERDGEVTLLGKVIPPVVGISYQGFGNLVHMTHWRLPLTLNCFESIATPKATPSMSVPPKSHAKFQSTELTPRYGQNVRQRVTVRGKRDELSQKRTVRTTGPAHTRTEI